MNLYRQIQSLKTQIVETEMMLALVKNHPIMSIGFKERLDNLRLELESLPKDVVEPKVQLLFSGMAVVGSQGIKSTFLGKILKSFQEMVNTQSALIRYGKVAERGKARRGSLADLYITALPTGSFGVELTQLQQNDFFEDVEVGQAIHEVMELIGDVCGNEENFENALVNTPKRNITNLKAFFKQVNDEQSMIKMQSGDFIVEAQYEDVSVAFTRLSNAVTEISTLFIKGVFRGALLDSGRFEIQDEEGNKYCGFISSEIDEDTLVNYDQNLLNQTCKFHLIVQNITFSTGKVKTSYELIEVNPA